MSTPRDEFMSPRKIQNCSSLDTFLGDSHSDLTEPCGQLGRWPQRFLAALTFAAILPVSMALAVLEMVLTMQIPLNHFNMPISSVAGRFRL